MIATEQHPGETDYSLTGLPADVNLFFSRAQHLRDTRVPPFPRGIDLLVSYQKITAGEYVVRLAPYMHLLADALAAKHGCQLTPIKHDALGEVLAALEHGARLLSSLRDSLFLGFTLVDRREVLVNELSETLARAIEGLRHAKEPNP